VQRGAVSAFWKKVSRTYERLQMKALRSFETSGYVKLPITQRNVPEGKTPEYRRCLNVGHGRCQSVACPAMGHQWLQCLSVQQY